MSTARSWFSNPFENPVLRREMMLLVRRGRFPWVVFVLTVAMTLVIAAVGGSSKPGMRPSDIGRTLFQTYFGIAHGLVLIAGPAIAASSIASEREGRTFELLALTGLPAERIARGKLLAALGNVGSYVIALAPVGALTFLFGGVSSWSMLIAFGMLAVVTVLSVLFGLAISAWLPTTRTALITAVLGGAGLAFVAYSLVGERAGDAVCQALGRTRPGTFWLPVIIVEAHPTALQVLALLGVPLLMSLLGAWLLFEVCVSNLSDPTADRSTRMKRWYAVASLLGAVACGALVFAAKGRAARATASISAVTLYVAVSIALAFVFQGDAVVAPRRVRQLWHSDKAGMLKRFFGPGISSTALMQIVANALGLIIISSMSILASFADEAGPGSATFSVVALAIPLFLFTLFVVGTSTFLRVRGETGVARVVLLLVLIVLFLAPYALSAVLNDRSSSQESLLGLLGTPSPWFAVDLARKMVLDNVDAREVIAVLLVAAVYASVGVVLLTSASIQSEKLILRLDNDAARVDKIIRDEDAGPTPTRASQPSPATTTETVSTTALAEELVSSKEEPVAVAEPEPAVPSVAPSTENGVEPQSESVVDPKATLPSGTPIDAVLLEKAAEKKSEGT